MAEPEGSIRAFLLFLNQIHFRPDSDPAFYKTTMAILFNFETRSTIQFEEISPAELDFRNNVLRESKRPIRWINKETLTDEFIDEMLAMIINESETKRYLIHWRTPSLAGTKNIGCTDFGQIGAIILKELFPPKGCPTIITKIELIEPEKYLQ